MGTLNEETGEVTSIHVLVDKTEIFDEGGKINKSYSRLSLL